MDKVEKILAVEDDARRSVAEARDTAAALRRESEDEVRRLRAAAAAVATAEAAARRGEVLAAAEAEASRMIGTAATEMDVAAAGAHAGLDAIANGLAARLKG